MTGIWLNIDDALAQRIRERAHRKGLSPDEYLASLAARDLGDGHAPGSEPAVHTAIGRLREIASEYGGLMDTSEAVRQTRDEA